MEKILVTGADGQLGKSIQKLSGKYLTLKFVFKNSKQLDITDSESVNSIFKKEDFNFCINCAAYTNVEQAEKTPEIAYKINADAVKNLALACKRNKVFLIHISTDFVFDGKQTRPYTEEDEAKPLNVYGVTKLKGEKVVEELLEHYFIIRTSWLYSEYENNFLKTMLRLGNENNEVRVVSDQIGTPTYARDLALLLILIIKKNKKPFGIYHYSNESEASWYDFAIAIFGLSNINIKVQPVKTKDFVTSVNRPIYSVMNKSKLKDNFGIVIPHWKDSLKECINRLAVNK